ncbi:hypothetical protein GMD78_18120 [Ornithinibacillus sp. L9]|uniref:Uncharacterized protein n=1 Tax=Ornithinibacillus caprae TaxID=2678566 RepID=A0A6N8FP05_9BACI|nr:hypothetical protein [Ornithinibacillus caprae]MUK90294.1 hypothetical protein [Ornithinibacillus caprae]
MNDNIYQELNKNETSKELNERSMLDLNQTKGKFIYIILFIILLIVNSYIFKHIYLFVIQHIITWRHYSVDIVMVLLFFIAFIPLTAFLSEKLAIFLLRKRIGEK